MSIMLLGCVAFMMAMFYLVNAEDPEFRYYSWDVLSTTISIFAAVLIFSTGNLTVCHFLGVEGEIDYQNVESFVSSASQMFFYYGMMQVSTFIACNGYADKPYGFGEEETAKEYLERTVKAYSLITSHLAGFALINLGALLQHGPFFERHPMATFLVVPLFLVLFSVIGRYVRAVRTYVQNSYIPDMNERHPSGRQRGGPTCGAGILQEKVWCLHLWEEEAYEGETDIPSLAGSFLLVQAMRYNISGVLPDALGIEHIGMENHQLLSVEMLTFVGVSCAGFAVVLVFLYDRHLRKVNSRMTWEAFLKRMTLIMANCFSMAMAWCMLYASKWQIHRSFPALGTPNSIPSRTLHALGISMGAFTVIYFLDKISDLSCTGESADKAIAIIIKSLGLLVGFCWEQCFDGGVEVIAERAPKTIIPMSIQELVMALLIASVVIPAWKMYILKTLIAEDPKKKAEEEAPEELSAMWKWRQESSLMEMSHREESALLIRDATSEMVPNTRLARR